MKQRVGWIDIAKGISLIAVILGHMGISAFNVVYSFHLTTFFILSGYTLRKTDITYSYLKQKFVRLMVPYFITCLAVVSMEVINSIIVQHNVTIHNITNILYRGIVKTFFGSGGLLNFGSIELGKGIGAIWFLPAMFFALIFIQLVLHLQSKFIQAIAALIMFVSSAITAKVFWLPFSIQAAMFAVPFILVGKWIKEYEILEKLKLRHYIIAFVVFMYGCYFDVAQVFYMVNCVAKDWVFTPLCAICSSMCIIGISRLIKHCPPIELIGKNSLIFLCVHLFKINTLHSYFEKAREILHLPYTFATRFIMEMLFVTAVSTIVVWISRYKKRTKECKIINCNYDMNIFHAFLTILIISETICFDDGLRQFINSFNIMSLVMISGYFYNSTLPLWDNIKQSLKTLLPYTVFGVIYIFYTHSGWWLKLKTLLFGLSSTNLFLSNINTLGPIYLILLLFVVKLIYILIDQILNKWVENLVIFSLFSAGLLLGYCGIWLPWTIDGALVSLLFYHIAHYIKKYGLLEKCLNLPAIYFPCSCIWAFMIYSGGMELTTRNYGNIGLTIAGVVSAFIISYLLCHYLAGCLPYWATRIVELISHSTAHILVLHTLFHERISSFAVYTLGLEPQNIFHLSFCVIVQIILGLLCYLIISQTKNFQFNIRSSN